MPVGFNSSPPTVFTVFLGVASIPTCNVDATYFRPKALYQNGNTQEQLASERALLLLSLIIIAYGGRRGRAP
jgi:hypothetical protein